jgi:hypothetical protein
MKWSRDNVLHMRRQDAILPSYVLEKSVAKKEGERKYRGGDDSISSDPNSKALA